MHMTSKLALLFRLKKKTTTKNVRRDTESIRELNIYTFPYPSDCNCLTSSAFCSGAIRANTVPHTIS